MSEWISVNEGLPDNKGLPYQVIAAQKNLHGGMYEDCHKRIFIQDWCIRLWPQNYIAWQYDNLGHVKKDKSKLFNGKIETATTNKMDLLAAYREKRKWDGGEGRVWNASKHLDADDLIKKLEEEYDPTRD